jgi:hypothetical protein
MIALGFAGKQGTKPVRCGGGEAHWDSFHSHGAVSTDHRAKLQNKLSRLFPRGADWTEQSQSTYPIDCGQVTAKLRNKANWGMERSEANATG